jgi:hypothetical protein
MFPAKTNGPCQTVKHMDFSQSCHFSTCDNLPGGSLGVAVGVGLGVGLGVSAALSGVFAAVGLVQFTVANAEEFINNPNVQPLGPWKTSESG